MQQEQTREEAKWARWITWAAAILTFRITNGLLIHTYFNPDEYWQSMEIAHEMVYGVGYRTWEWHHQIRGYLHPLLYAMIYYIVDALGLSSSFMSAYAPRILQSMIAAGGDISLYTLAHRCFGPRVANWTMFALCLNWFYFYCICRTYSNSIETVLTITALSQWPIPGFLPAFPGKSMSQRRRFALMLAALSVIVRPTSAIIWIFLGVIELFRLGNISAISRLIFNDAVPIGIVTILLSCIVDKIGYGDWVLVPWNFFVFNSVQGGSQMYGVHPWHWYFSQGFPAMLGLYLPYTFAGVYLSRKPQFAVVIVWSLFIYSLNPHKEFRFVLPVLPLALMYAGYTLNWIHIRYQKKKSCFYKLFPLSVTILFILNLGVGLYFSLVHQRGPISVTRFLADYEGPPEVTSIHFLTNCHATPYYSHIHKPIPMSFLDCSPEFKGSKLVGDRSNSESERFLRDPEGFVRSFYHSSAELPSHIVMFSEHFEVVHSFLYELGFRELERFFHSHLEEEAMVILHRPG